MFFSRGSGGYVYVPRISISGWDFSVGSFTRDGALHNLDLSSIVPASAKLVHVKILIRAAVIQRFFGVCSPNETNNQSLQGTYCVVANRDHHCQPLVPVNSSGQIKYFAEDAQLTVINLNVIGWWK